MPETILLPLAQIREPQNAIRIEMDDEKLNSLAASIRDLGILEPLIVKPNGEATYEVVAGHRRLLAARIAGIAAVPCIIETDESRLDAIRLHENIEREELNTAAEAVFYHDLYEKLGSDTEAVAQTVRKSRDYVENRLALFAGQKEVFEALQAGKIPFGVAQELNRMTLESDRLFHLDHCARGGASIRLVRDWRIQANERAKYAAEVVPAAESGGGNAQPEGATPPPEMKYAGMARPHELSSSLELRPCLFCSEEHEEWKMYRKFVCSPCADRHLVPLEKGR